jgi:O-antigen/teichoic acid export membrane protein
LSSSVIETGIGKSLSSDAPKISHAVLLTSAQLVRAVSRLLFALIVARALGPEQFGVYTLLLAVVEIAAVVSGIGYGDYATREAAKDRRMGWGLGEQLTWLRIAYAIPFAGLALGLLWLLSYPRLVLVGTAWILLTLVPRALTETIQGVLRGTGNCWEYIALDVVFGSVLVLGAGVILARGGGVLMVVAIELAAATAAGTAAFALTVRLRTKERIRLEWSALLKKSFVFNLYPFVITLYDRVDVLLLSKLGGDYATGIYGAAYRPLSMVQILPYGILYSLLPALSRGDWRGAARERLERAMGLLLSAAFLIVLATMIFADALVPLLLGVRFVEAAAALKILIWAVILRYLNYGLNMGLLAAKRERVFVMSSSVSLAVNFIGNMIFIPMFSWRAAAVLTIITELVVLNMNLYWLRQVTGTILKPLRWARISWVFAALLTIALAGAKVVSPSVIGTVCLLSFLTYLYRTGMVGEFAAAWGAARSRALEGSNS